jgi:hypothetical protein
MNLALFFVVYLPKICYLLVEIPYFFNLKNHYYE